MVSWTLGSLKGLGLVWPYRDVPQVHFGVMKAYASPESVYSRGQKVGI